MSGDQPTYEELVETNKHLANVIVNIGRRHEAQLQERMAEAWDRGFDAGERDALSPDIETHACIPNPYRGQS